jgi:hypothetical protein
VRVAVVADVLREHLGEQSSRPRHHHAIFAPSSGIVIPSTVLKMWSYRSRAAREVLTMWTRIAIIILAMILLSPLVARGADLYHHQ